MIELVAGGNAPVPTSLLTVRVNAGIAVDVSCFRLYANGKVAGDADMVFYGQKSNADGTIKLIAEGVKTEFAIDLSKIRADVQSIAFTATCEKGQTIASLKTLSLEVVSAEQSLIKCTVDLNSRTEAALILGEIYRRNGAWKLRSISQGFNGGLKPLAEHFGVDIADEQSSAPINNQVSSNKSVNLNKVSLTKEKPKVNLAKKDDFGMMKVNLNWNKSGQQVPIDLDLGAFVRMNDGWADVIQALGGNFGAFLKEPFVELMDDDRTGAATDGEWLHVNGRHWKEINEVLIYAFIYDGIPSWDGTDGVVTIHIPGQQPIETKLTAGEPGKRMCAIARLKNINGSIDVERINEYFQGHSEMDKRFAWGFTWHRGSK